MLSLTQATPQDPHLPLYFSILPGAGSHRTGVIIQDTGLYIIQCSRQRTRAVGPRFQEAVHNSQGHLCTNFQPLTLCARLAMTSLVWAFCPGKHRPVGQSQSSPLAVTQKGQMSRMTKALQQLCMTPTAPTALWHTSIALFHTSTASLQPPVTIAGTVVHDHSAYPHHHSAITHPWTPRSAVAHSHSTLPQPHINLAHHFRLCRQSWQPLAMHPCFHKSAFLLDPSASPFSYSASSASYSLET